MPYGGLKIFASGLPVQPVYPGTSTVGNANLTGVFHAGRVTTTPPAFDGGGNGGEQFGHAITYTGGADPTSARHSVALGVQLNIGSGVADGLCAGFNCSIYGQNSVAVGTNCAAGNSTNLPSSPVAMGFNVQVNSVPGGSIASTVGVGAQITVQNQSVALGAYITSASPNGLDLDSVFVGNGITATTATKCVALGRGISVAGGVNRLVVGWYSGDQPVTPDNSIIIGRASQSTKVQIGPYLIGQSSGSSVTANDVDVVMTSAQGKILYSAITVSRTVTLPAANTVPAGFPVSVADFSGSAAPGVTITVGPSGADTLVGVAGVTAIINAAYDSRRFMSDGVSKWNVVNGW